ncbi:MAG: YicC family protein, partial [Deltaproteobacteria bacterium]|nr:YicC family protein [Deltaproteobacteria bacterium]
EYPLELNAPLVKSYLRIFRELDEEYGLDERVSPDSLCQMKDIIIFKTPHVEIDDVRPGLQEALGLAVESLDKMKITEGKAIEEDFLKRLEIIEEYLSDIEESAPMMVDEYKKRLEDKIQKVSGGITLDESRLIQEVAIFADRCDINEEIVRFRSHLKQYRDFMSKDDSIGRRLDFLIQEINREVNTIGSKATDSFISSKVVEIKAELEKLREQVQNVE